MELVLFMRVFQRPNDQRRMSLTELCNPVRCRHVVREFLQNEKLFFYLVLRPVSYPLNMLVNKTGWSFLCGFCIILYCVGKLIQPQPIQGNLKSTTCYFVFYLS